MDSQNLNKYRFIEDPQFLDQLYQHLPNIKRWDEIKLAFACELTINPYLAHKIPGTTLRMMALNTTPPFTIFFRIEEKTHSVILLEIHQV